MGAAVSPSHAVCAAPSSSRPSPAPWGPSHCRLFSTSCPGVGPSHGCSPSGNCSSVGPPQGHEPCQQTCSGASSSLHGATAPTRSLLQHWLPTEPQPPPGIPCSSVGSCLGCGSAPPWAFTAARTACPAMGCSRGTSAPVLGAPPALLQLARPWPVLGSTLEPVPNSSIRHRGSFQQLLTEATIQSPPATKTLPCKPNTFTNNTKLHQKDLRGCIATKEKIKFKKKKNHHSSHNTLGDTILVYKSINDSHLAILF